MALRILASAILLLSILFMPLWVSVILGLAGMIYFSIFWEATVLFLFSDLLYGVRETKFSGTVFLSFFIAVIFLIVLEILKKKLRIYNNK